MKNTIFRRIYTFNKYFMIAFLLLMLTVYLGILFLIPLGFAQIICFCVLLFNRQHITKQIANHFFIYGLTALSVVILQVGTYYHDWLTNDVAMLIPIISGAALAFYFTYITYLCKKHASAQTHCYE